ncbi:tRNA (adenosine(37)-N6)-threonylcarbamoyltransferase complex dimerization subunit type 1 TsaB [Salipaludibacillus agaradhaerens]|uniref:tRNA (adenosine(37)-N6)-threonylcarbamoyltransferase complex dimerization subunit type 1 TsaB n=1 Tax=Salipaludibacillus agaradhaerens TaxID=76935 RepID=UPI00215199A3|nr:tRNA (adenosine(37)-N6)-threonylcarbamoyltransferase complex dimerization subunit type 1 TsaB [Salipaludibacillus agaradhaerens]MCR6105366.1 tRNA (adenosine(37)-N6)-threonylcarbamoyltransferase complex dimerization subunit type 1 TsaB [Salipaludibacillus agaradhaerens]MCR6117407.1 tRNA (adenosine(37)-N6)-threonylcarbamoyltransferase complex dimerization subunit type 1 TsaB [Salipaludibacillus agaradhaerens]
MNVLAIDTATYVMGVALMRDGEPLGEIVTHQKKNHSIRLMPAIQTLFKETEMSPEDLDRIVVSQGPGSYTGVRIGVTTAKTLAWALNIPIVGVSSMAMLAGNGRYFNGLISPFFDARRGQVFTGLYQNQGDSLKEIETDRITMHHDWLHFIKERDESILFLSPDMDKHADDIHQILGEQAVFASPIHCLPRPFELALAGMALPVEENTHAFSPRYHRLAEAEAKWLEANKEK